MRYTLKDYQAEAVRDVLRNLDQARDMYHRYGSLSQFSLTATTGAGKTVMAAAVIEALFFGNDEFDFEADPGAVVLWFSDDPSLNEQSRARLQEAASDLDSRLRMIETTFSEPSLRPGNVYFLNTQKLSKNSRLVRGAPSPMPGQDRLYQPRPDEVQSSIYDVITNTVENKDLTLYFVLDEAHRGMGTTSKDRSTIVQRLINGNGAVPPMPVVFGISATVERFETAMKDAKGRTALPSVVVDSALVQASGLLKDDIVLSIPTEQGVFDTVLLRRAVEKVRASTAAWRADADEQEEADPAIPLLVVQVGDKPTQETLVQVLDTIYDAWPELGPDAVANVFGEHQDLLIGQQNVPYIEPQRVQDSTHVRVLLAKSAISTGWDCPRAEVLVSMRPAKDRTHITQLLGRMIRTPLARRIPGNELLNSVDCLLPFFARKTATGVAEMLMKGATSKDEEETGTGGGEGRRVLFEPVDLLPNPAVPQEVWDRFATLPSVTIPKKGVKPIRRLTALATALSKDGLVEGAVAESHRYLHAVLDGRAVQYKDKVDTARTDVLTMSGEEARGRIGGGVTYKSFQESADPRAIEDSYRAATRVLSPALCSTYVDHLVPADSDDDELLDANITVAALGRVEEIAQAVEHEADALAARWLNQTRVARKGLPDERQAEYDRLEGMSTQPERISLTVPKAAQAETMVRELDGTESPLETRLMHLMAAQDGTYPITLNDWERKVLDSEAKQPGFKGWYRNPARATKESLAIAYKEDTGNWKAVRPDFIFFGTDHTGAVVADLVDPHGHHLSDALPKLRGLAAFAEKYQSEFRRIESVAETGGAMRVLDLTKHHVRQAIRDAKTAKGLYESGIASDY
ncbi:DEAD/DEAH box helicase family protein [Brachybacterium sp. Marseille-Q2903]|uniref:DEAD/DEAH box helicase family protein n=1 Tax=Brachybacterium epidermidis TaxID=2781983 RepID=A0ABR9W2D7_9MICO|nr:DEAD/DEAH box helicase family protein [Brachybacterium epidermidis]MBE9404594.1 DEAD/DEAH box helicase family protein [Brachybacterium epidermidis]